MPLRFTPGDFPGNPLEKASYRLEFHDEFTENALDFKKWLPFHLPQWSSRALSAPNCSLEHGHLILSITRDQPPWCPEFNGQIRCSSLQTGVFAGPVGSQIGQHRFNRLCVVREAQQNQRTYTPRYGYFETRIKAAKTATNHVALWMIGYEDRPERSAEICICEIMGAYVTPTSSRIGYGVHPWSDPNINDEFYEDFLELDANDFHIYAAEWCPTGIDFYIDNQRIKTIEQSPRYPMQFMLGIYELPNEDAEQPSRDASYPKEFIIDYFRAYQPVRDYSTAPIQNG
jgi:hypothetical protein